MNKHTKYSCNYMIKNKRKCFRSVKHRGDLCPVHSPKKTSWPNTGTIYKIYAYIFYFKQIFCELNLDFNYDLLYIFSNSLVTKIKLKPTITISEIYKSRANIGLDQLSVFLNIKTVVSNSNNKCDIMYKYINSDGSCIMFSALVKELVVYDRLYVDLTNSVIISDLSCYSPSLFENVVVLFPLMKNCNSINIVNSDCEMFGISLMENFINMNIDPKYKVYTSNYSDHKDYIKPTTKDILKSMNELLSAEVHKSDYYKHFSSITII